MVLASIGSPSVLFRDFGVFRGPRAVVISRRRDLAENHRKHGSRGIGEHKPIADPPKSARSAKSAFQKALTDSTSHPPHRGPFDVVTLQLHLAENHRKHRNHGITRKSIEGIRSAQIRLIRLIRVQEDHNLLDTPPTSTFPQPSPTSPQGFLKAQSLFSLANEFPRSFAKEISP
jgi:hypothetical protein